MAAGWLVDQLHRLTLSEVEVIVVVVLLVWAVIAAVLISFGVRR